MWVWILDELLQAMRKRKQYGQYRLTRIVHALTWKMSLFLEAIHRGACKNKLHHAICDIIYE